MQTKTGLTGFSFFTRMRTFCGCKNLQACSVRKGGRKTEQEPIAEEGKLKCLQRSLKFNFPVFVWGTNDNTHFKYPSMVAQLPEMCIATAEC